jgi:hypothetical protein
LHDLVFAFASFLLSFFDASIVYCISLIVSQYRIIFTSERKPKYASVTPDSSKKALMGSI